MGTWNEPKMIWKMNRWMMKRLLSQSAKEVGRALGLMKGETHQMYDGVIAAVVPSFHPRIGEPDRVQPLHEFAHVEFPEGVLGRATGLGRHEGRRVTRRRRLRDSGAAMVPLPFRGYLPRRRVL